MSIQEPFVDDRYAELKAPILRVLLVGAVGGVVGGVCYTIFALAYDAFVIVPARIPGAPMLSYGQQCGYMMVVAVFLGACATSSLLLALRWNCFAGAALGLLAGLAVVSHVEDLWNDSNSRYGVDPSDGVLYPPLMAAAVLVIAVGVVLGICGLIPRSYRHETPLISRSGK